VTLAEDDLDRGVCAMEVAEHVEDATVDGRPDEPDPEGSAQQPVQRGDRVAAALERGDRGAGVRQQLLACLGEAGSALVAVKEGLSELCLEAPDLVADGSPDQRPATTQVG
jgi:hypothetical protein